MKNDDVIHMFFPQVERITIRQSIGTDYSRDYFADMSADLCEVVLREPHRVYDVALIRAPEIASPPESDELFVEHITGKIVVGYFNLTGTLQARGSAVANDSVLRTTSGDYCVALLAPTGY